MESSILSYLRLLESIKGFFKDAKDTDFLENFDKYLLVRFFESQKPTSKISIFYTSAA